MPSWWEHVHTEASLFVLGCMAVGCVGGLVVTGCRIWFESFSKRPRVNVATSPRRHGSLAR